MTGRDCGRDNRRVNGSYVSADKDFRSCRSECANSVPAAAAVCDVAGDSISAPSAGVTTGSAGVRSERAQVGRRPRERELVQLRQPAVDFALGLVAREAVFLLHEADQAITSAGDLIDLIVGQLSP